MPHSIPIKELKNPSEIAESEPPAYHCDRLRTATGRCGQRLLQSIDSHLCADLKTLTAEHIGFTLWQQRSYHDHIIRNEDEYDRIIPAFDYRDTSNQSATAIPFIVKRRTSGCRA
jgi:hypothetical protein